MGNDIKNVSDDGERIEMSNGDVLKRVRTRLEADCTDCYLWRLCGDSVPCDSFHLYIKID